MATKPFHNRRKLLWLAGVQIHGLVAVIALCRSVHLALTMICWHHPLNRRNQKKMPNLTSTMKLRMTITRHYRAYSSLVSEKKKIIFSLLFIFITSRDHKIDFNWRMQSGFFVKDKNSNLIDGDTGAEQSAPIHQINLQLKQLWKYKITIERILIVCNTLLRSICPLIYLGLFIGSGKSRLAVDYFYSRFFFSFGFDSVIQQVYVVRWHFLNRFSLNISLKHNKSDLSLYQSIACRWLIWKHVVQPFSLPSTWWCHNRSSFALSQNFNRLQLFFFAASSENYEKAKKKLKLLKSCFRNELRIRNQKSVAQSDVYGCRQKDDQNKFGQNEGNNSSIS